MKNRLNKRSDELRRAAISFEYYNITVKAHRSGFQYHVSINDPLHDDRWIQLIVVHHGDRYEVKLPSPTKGYPIFFGDPNGDTNLPRKIELCDPDFGNGLKWFRDLIDRWINRCITYLSDRQSVLRQRWKWSDAYSRSSFNRSGTFALILGLRRFRAIPRRRSFFLTEAVPGFEHVQFSSQFEQGPTKLLV